MDRSENEYSMFVSETLDTMGYTSSMIKYRREMSTEQLALIMRKSHGCVILVGSTGEGISRLKESDIDIMFVEKDIRCADDVTQCNPRHIRFILQLDRRDTAPGYTRLSPMEDVKDVIMSNKGLGYIPNSVFELAMNERSFTRILDIQGPSICVTTFDGEPIDFVEAFCCQCPDILYSWLTRQRKHDWPSREIVQEVSTLEAHVVPVGNKRSYEQDIEWRICYTLAEQALVRSFNDTQTKVYILLKFLAKSVLKTVCGGMTSYVMKNIILWLSELSQTSRFTAELLIDRLVCSLRLLSIFIASGCLPSYMIPERNLLSGNLRPGDQKRLLSVLSDLISEGGSMLLRCDKLKLTMLKMYKKPDATREKGETDDTLERLIMQYDNLLSGLGHVSIECGSFEEKANDIDTFLDSKQPEETVVIFGVMQQISQLILPDRDILCTSGKNINTILRKRYINLLARLS